MEFAYTLLLLILAFSGGLLVTFIMAHQQLRRYLLQRKNMEVTLDSIKKQFDILTKKTELEKWEEIEKMRVEERKRVATDLHDGLGADLAQVQYWLSLLDFNKLTDRELGFVRNARAAVGKLAGTTRNIAYNLVPIEIDELGLVVAIEKFLLGKGGIKGINFIFYKLGKERKLTSTLELMIFRSIQELVTNSIKHSVCWHVWFKLIWEDNQVVLEAEDDGSNLSPSVISKSIKRRVNLAGGTLVKMQQFKGLHIQIIFPG